MHNGDANFKTLTPRILNLEQNIKGNDFVLHMSHSSIVYNKYVLYVCTVPTASHSSTIECANYLFFGALKTYS